MSRDLEDMIELSGKALLSGNSVEVDPCTLRMWLRELRLWRRGALTCNTDNIFEEVCNGNRNSEMVQRQEGVRIHQA